MNHVAPHIMPKELPQDLTERILRVVAAFPGGAGKGEIAKVLGKVASSRTLARRLAELVAAKRLDVTGKARAVRYSLPPIQGSGSLTAAPAHIEGTAEVDLPVSVAGRKVRELVRKPLTERRPIGYKRDFLEGYLPNRTWYLPVAARKRLHVLGTRLREERPAGTFARGILDRLLIDLSWASSRLEGNTYSRLDTKNLIELGQAAEGKDQAEAQMILNHKAAIEMLVDHVDEIGFNAYTVRNLHAILSENLLGDPAMSGRLRARIVEIGGTVFHPLSIPQQVEEYFRMILDKANAIGDPFEQAFFAMVHIPYLQPFIDVNKRVSRLAANIPLIRRNLCPLSFVDVPERAYFEGIVGVYELNRVELLRDVFVWAYERSCQRFTAIRDTIPVPDPVRLRNREQLSTVVADVVRSLEAITIEGVRERAAPVVDAADLDRFVEMAVQDLHNLHEGNVARYRLALAEYRGWSKLHQPKAR